MNVYCIDTDLECMPEKEGLSYMKVSLMSSLTEVCVSQEPLNYMKVILMTGRTLYQ
jgi:hypothetical protein